MQNRLIAFIAAVLISPAAWAAPHGGGGSGHGHSVSAAAHSAHQGGMPAGPSVRSVARANSQGPTHASANAISHVQNSPGKANSNSVLGNGGTTTTTTTSTQALATTSTKSAKAKGKSKHIH